MKSNQLLKTPSIQSIRFYTLLFYLLVSPFIGNASPQAQLTASRVTGPAPLAVFFDATGTTDTNSSLDTFRQLGYSFCFGDSNSGNWQHSSLSKNMESGGPLAAHVFDLPGVYQVQLRATNPDGSYSDASITITVLDPDDYYENTNTVVLSMGSDFTGAPNNSSQLGNINSWPNWESNKRYLLKEGDDFTSLGDINISDVSNFQVSSFGNDTKPIVSGIYVTMNEDNAATPPENGVIQGLAAHFINQRLMFKDLLIYKNDVIGNGSSIGFAAANTWYAINQRGNSQPEDWKQSGPIFIVENHVNMLGDPTGPLNAIAGLAHHIAVLGNTSEQAKEHTLRIFGTYKAVVSHNLLTGPATDSGRHDLKLMSNGLNDWPADHSIFASGTTTEILPNTQYVRISNNIFGSSNSVSEWHVQVAPQDAGSSDTVEGLRDIIIENNEFINGTQDDGVEVGIQTLGHNIIERNNTFPATWTRPVFTKSYPSNYTAYSTLYTPFWHGPYLVDDTTPTISSPSCSGVLSIDNHEIFESIKAFPNPLNFGDLTITFPQTPKNGNLKIVGLLGKTIYTQVIEQNTIKIPSYVFNTGLYLLVIETNKGTQTKKIMVAN